MSRLVVPRLPQRVVTRGKRTRRALAMHPGEVAIHNFLPRDVVTDEIHQLSIGTRKYFLKSLEHEGVNQHMVDRRKVRTE